MKKAWAAECCPPPRNALPSGLHLRCSTVSAAGAEVRTRGFASLLIFVYSGFSFIYSPFLNFIYSSIDQRSNSSSTNVSFNSLYSQGKDFIPSLLDSGLSEIRRKKKKHLDDVLSDLRRHVSVKLNSSASLGMHTLRKVRHADYAQEWFPSPGLGIAFLFKRVFL